MLRVGKISWRLDLVPILEDVSFMIHRRTWLNLILVGRILIALDMKERRGWDLQEEASTTFLFARLLTMHHWEKRRLVKLEACSSLEKLCWHFLHWFQFHIRNARFRFLRVNCWWKVNLVWTIMLVLASNTYVTYQIQLEIEFTSNQLDPYPLEENEYNMWSPIPAPYLICLHL